MRFINKLIIFVSLLLPVSIFGADTLKIHLTYKHKLDDAGRTQGYITINQKFYSPDEVLFREINFNEQNSQIRSYIFYFYTGQKLSTEECYNQSDSLLYILKHEYDAAGHENRVQRFEPVNGIMQVAYSTVKSYDDGGHLIRQKDYTGKKLGTSILYKYNKLGFIDRESRKFKPVAQKTLKNEIRRYIYNPDNSVKQILVSGKNVANHAIQETEDYFYNEKGLLASLTVSGSSHPEGLVKSYKYLNSGILSLYEEGGKDGKINLLLQYDYKKHYMNRGSQVSYFDRPK